VVLLLLPACSGLGERLGRATRSDAALDSARVADSLRAAAPDTATVVVLPSSVDSNVTWAYIERLVRANPESVRAVMQRHDRKVSIVFLDGRRYHATEPAIDGIIALVRDVDPAGRILIATE
jgi:tRNA C32,U32 (ribose-2'-O)-methylase TrmJ